MLANVRPSYCTSFLNGFPALRINIIMSEDWGIFSGMITNDNLCETDQSNYPTLNLFMKKSFVSTKPHLIIHQLTLAKTLPAH